MMMEKGLLNTGDLDNCINPLIELSFSDMFGQQGEDMEGSKLLSKAFFCFLLLVDIFVNRP